MPEASVAPLKLQSLPPNQDSRLSLYGLKTVTRCSGAALMDEDITLIPSDVAVLRQNRPSGPALK